MSTALTLGGIHRAQSLGLFHLADAIALTSAELSLRFKDPLMRILNEMTHQIHMSLLKTSGFEGLTRKWMSCMDLLRGMVNIYKKGSTPSQDGVLVIIRTLDNDLRKQSSDFFEHMELFQAEVQRFSGDSQDLVIPPADIRDGGVSHPLFQPDGVAPPPHPAFGGDAVGPSIFAIQPPISAIAVPSTGQGGAGKRLRDSEVDDLWKGDTNGPLKKSRIPAAAAAMQPSARLTRQVGGEGGLPSAFSRPATSTPRGRGEEVGRERKKKATRTFNRVCQLFSQLSFFLSLLFLDHLFRPPQKKKTSTRPSAMSSLASSALAARSSRTGAYCWRDIV